MRKKKKTVLATASLMMTIPRDLYYQTSSVFGIGLMLMLLAVAVPTTIYFHHRAPATAPSSQAGPLMIKAHMQQAGAHKTVA